MTSPRHQTPQAEQGPDEGTMVTREAALSVIAQVRLRILERHSDGEPFTARMFAAMGTPDAVRMTLLRLLNSEFLQRLKRGWYFRSPHSAPQAPRAGSHYLTGQVRWHIQEHLPAEEPFSAATFAALGTRKAVGRVLTRLAEHGHVRRVSAGAYVRQTKPEREITAERPQPVVDQIAEYIETRLLRGAPFTARTFRPLGCLGVNTALIILTRYGLITRLGGGVYVRPHTPGDADELASYASFVPVSLTEQIRRHILTHHPREPFRSSTLKAYGDQKCVYTVLSVLARQGLIRRADHGVYVRVTEGQDVDEAAVARLVSVTRKIRAQIEATSLEEPFSADAFDQISSRKRTQTELKILLRKGVVRQVTAGVYARVPEDQQVPETCVLRSASMAAQIQAHVQALPAGAQFSPRTLLQFAAPGSVHQKLKSMTRQGLIGHVSRGVYVRLPAQADVTVQA